MVESGLDFMLGLTRIWLASSRWWCFMSVCGVHTPGFSSLGCAFTFSLLRSKSSVDVLLEMAWRECADWMVRDMMLTGFTARLFRIGSEEVTAECSNRNQS